MGPPLAFFLLDSEPANARHWDSCRFEHGFGITIQVSPGNGPNPGHRGVGQLYEAGWGGWGAPSCSPNPPRAPALVTGGGVGLSACAARPTTKSTACSQGFSTDPPTLLKSRSQLAGPYFLIDDQAPAGFREKVQLEGGWL